MFENPSLVTRIAIGKAIGLALGLIGLIVMPIFWPDSSWMERLAFLFWYTTLGAFVGLVGVFNWHPILRLPMPWWFRSTVVGAWMNFVLTLFIYDRLEVMMLQLMGEDGLFLSPFWFVVEGAIVGLLIGYVATRYGGEGPATVQPQVSSQ
jgi:hypothetical protein